MNTSKGLVVAMIVALAVFAFSAVAPGCGSSSGTDAEVAGDGGGVADSGNGGGNDGGGGDTGTTGDALTCANYCGIIMGGCTAGNQQYSDLDNCKNSCAAFTAGTLADTSGDTLGCRIYHATVAAASADNAVVHCPHAGPGGDGTCGANCDGYCDIAQKYCAGSSQIYTDRADCMATCGAKPDTLKFNVSIQTGDSVACLLYHSQEASTVPPDHCLGDMAKTSTTCK